MYDQGNQPDSCLGVVELSTSSWMIALVQIVFNIVYLMKETDLLHSELGSVSFLQVSLLLSDILGIVAAFTLSIGNMM